MNNFLVLCMEALSVLSGLLEIDLKFLKGDIDEKNSNSY